MSEPSLAAKVAFLRRPETYQDQPVQVDAIETHMSWVFLTNRFVYKLKKPIGYDRLDFTTLALRRRFCEEEVRLNRRLAKEVYLGMLALTEDSDGRLALEGEGPAVEWLIQMRRLPASRMLDWILARRVVLREEVLPVATLLAEFFDGARRVTLSLAEHRKRLEEGIESDREELSRSEFGLDRDRIERVASEQMAFLEWRSDLFAERIEQGRLIDGHGDLRPEHICLTPEPSIIDCLEFCAELRELDPADELAFLCLECERLGQPDVGRWFLEVYEDRTKDLIPRPLLAFYRRYRILRRAKIAAWHLNDPETRDRERYAARARRYLELAGSSGVD